MIDVQRSGAHEKRDEGLTLETTYVVFFMKAGHSALVLCAGDLEL